MMCNKVKCRFVSWNCILGFSGGNCQNCYKPVRRSEEDIKQLKENWFEDPVWDIETTEGFEYHKKELLQYKLECEKCWNEEQEKEEVVREEKIRRSAAELRIQDINLYKLVLKQADTIERLESAICSLCDKEFNQAWRILRDR